MLQLVLEFQLEKPEVSQDYDKLLLSFMKAAVQEYSQEMFQSLYDKSRSVTKLYTFSCYLPGAKFADGKLLLTQRNFKMFFSSADMAQIIEFFNAFKQMRYKTYPMSDGNSMQLKAVRAQTKKDIDQEEIIVKMQSSLLVRRHDRETNKDTYYTCEDPEFSEVLKENTEFFLQKMGLEVSTEDFSIIPIKGKKIVARVYGRETDASIGVYKLTGKKELLNLLYQSGIGVRRSLSHGKFELIW